MKINLSKILAHKLRPVLPVRGELLNVRRWGPCPGPANSMVGLIDRNPLNIQYLW